MTHTKQPYKTDVLFINKQRTHTSDYAEDWGCTHNSQPKSSGLAVSVSMVVSMLVYNGVKAVVEEAIDNNCIDRLVTKHRPKFVIIEALWVVPEKFTILRKLHPTVKWIIRLHSEIPFISNEGISMEWIRAYATQFPNIIIAANSPRMQQDLINILHTPVVCLPNYYATEHKYAKIKSLNDTVHVSCFGAIRPLKNQLIQAVAAIHYATTHNLSLNFHINSSRVEGKGIPILKNIRALFNKYPGHTLVEHPWLNPNEFKQLIRSTIDVGMQVSFTESYNIVTADHIDCGVPVIVSPEIKFVCIPYQANPTNVSSIYRALSRAMFFRKIHLHKLNNIRLSQFNRQAERNWLHFITGNVHGHHSHQTTGRNPN